MVGHRLKLEPCVRFVQVDMHPVCNTLLMKLGYTIIYVPDVPESLKFYERAFGLNRQFLHESGDYGELATGEIKLAFASESLIISQGIIMNPNRSHDKAPGFELALVTHDVAAALKQATEAGATLVSQPEEKPWGQMVAYVRDLNGVLVELCTPIQSS